MKKVLTTPIRNEDIADIKVGDVVYLDGYLITCRDVAHRRLIELGRELPVDLKGLAIFHAGPIVAKDGEKYNMVSIGPTTSMRMEKFEKEFIEQTGVKLIIGKGGMGPNTEAGCKEQKALHAVFPGGCAVLAATQVEEIERAEWQDLGMPETLWVNAEGRRFTNELSRIRLRRVSAERERIDALACPGGSCWACGVPSPAA